MKRTALALTAVLVSLVASIPVLAQPTGAPGPIVSRTDGGADPAEGDAHYYLVGYAHESGAGLTSLIGRESDGSIRAEPAICQP